ncbi:hypothetical protein U9M48_041725 [Paspalum notatum var. saurae]|uniref:Rx N-terminal domain-containing protein n=1 Tax=Paspalum notatum var. saurae TaxID=547442 RepID=A0AAQ3UT88_PASNO
MAELATGAVSSLLGVIRNEVALLGGVRDDVQFIKEEMESMNSFLLHLARTTPPGGEHDEQVQTWMGQVRLLAQDCNNCIDLYLYRGNPEIHLPKSGPLRYLWWTPWFVRKLVAQHRAAFQLRALKDRARDVGERRLRYGVEVPEKAVRQAAAAAAAGDDEQADHQLVLVAATAADHPLGHRLRPSSVEPYTIDDYFETKLIAWINDDNNTSRERGSPSVAVVAPSAETSAAVREASAVAENHFGQTAVFVDIPAVHWDWGALPRPKDILYYILREFEPKLGEAAGGTAEDEKQPVLSIQPYADEWDIYWEKRDAFEAIKEIIQRMKVDDKFEEIKKQIRQVTSDQLRMDPKQIKRKQGQDKDNKRSIISSKDLFVLIVWLVNPSAAAAEWHSTDVVIEEAAKKLKKHIEHEDESAKRNQGTIRLQEDWYKQILTEVLHKITGKQNTKQQGTETATDTSAAMVEDQIKEMIHKVTEMLHHLQEDNSDDRKQQGGRWDDQDQIKDIVTKAEQAITNIRWKIREQLKIQWMVDRIKDRLNGKTALVILKTDDNTMDGSRWQETRSNALSLLDSAVHTLIFTTTTSTQNAKEYCNPQREPIHYSLVGLYNDIVLNVTSQHRNENNCDHQIFRAILDLCEPHEFCMKIFAHALYVNPKRSSAELHKLHTDLQAVSPKSFGNIAKKMLKFSYNDLLKEYKSCLLYLAIFFPGQKIRWSTLIARWVVEGLITTEDWRWSSSVKRASRCFDTLINQWLVYPTDVGSTGEVKGCMVGELVHGFITKIAGKQHIMETRLSHHLARHFSISNDLRLRGSDKIETFLDNPSQAFKFSLLKVLDLEGCRCFGVRSKRYLKNICCKIKLLKYLSLRRTDITHLHSKINNLHELEVLDIRQTCVAVSATRNVRLLKLKRLLAGDSDPSPSSNDISTTVKNKEIPTTCVDIPEKVENMEGMELRKLGLVIEDRKSHLSGLLQAIRSLQNCLRSLSITIVPKARLKATTSREESPDDSTASSQRCPPSVLESLKICGTTKKVQLLQSLLGNKDQLTKVTLSKTGLSQNNLEVLAKLPKLQCMRLRHEACKEKILTFKKGEFQQLKYFVLENSNVTNIIFDDLATPELEKIVLTLNDHLNLFGVEKLPRLKELELNSNNNKINNSNSSKNDCNDINSIAADATTNTGAAISTTDTTTTNNNNAVNPTADANPTTTPTNNNNTFATTDTNDTKINTSINTLDTTTTTTDATTPTNTITPTTNGNDNVSATTTTEFASAHIANTNTGATTHTNDTIVVTTTTTTDATPIATPTTNTTTFTSTTDTNTIKINTSVTTPAATNNAITPTTDNNVATAITNIDTTASATPTIETTSAPTATTDTIVASPTTIGTTAIVTTDPTPTTINTNMFLSLLEKTKGITKVTLCGTMLKEDDLQILADKATLRCLVLLYKAYDKNQLTFNENKFPKLNLLIIERDIMEISFNVGSCPKLERFVWTFENIKSLHGISNLLRLKELEFNGGIVPSEVKEFIDKLKDRVYFTHYISENEDQAGEHQQRDASAAKFPCFWKNKCRRRGN